MLPLCCVEQEMNSKAGVHTNKDQKETIEFNGGIPVDDAERRVPFGAAL
jgi:hypothetical protein